MPAPPPACPACAGPCRAWTSAPGGEPDDSNRYELWRCTRCGSARTAAAPAADAHASGVYSPARPRLGGALALLRRPLTRQPLALLRRAGTEPGSRVLDAGAGTGKLVEALVAAGYEARGIDASQRSVDIASAEGVPVALQAIEEHEDSGLDAVVLWHVLEHLEDPAAALRRSSGWLRPGGVLLVAVPNVASLQARIAGPGWFHLDLPRHRSHFTPAGLDALAAACGLRRTGRVRQLVYEHNFHAMWFALLERIGMTRGFPFHLLKRNVGVRPYDLAVLAIAGPLLLPVAVALELVAAALRRGGTVAATFEACPDVSR